MYDILLYSIQFPESLQIEFPTFIESPMEALWLVRKTTECNTMLWTRIWIMKRTLITESFIVIASILVVNSCRLMSLERFTLTYHGEESYLRFAIYERFRLSQSFNLMIVYETLVSKTFFNFSGTLSKHSLAFKLLWRDGDDKWICVSLRPCH